MNNIKSKSMCVEAKEHTQDSKVLTGPTMLTSLSIHSYIYVGTQTRKIPVRVLGGYLVRVL